MKRLTIVFVTALAFVLGPLGLQPRADDAHHPEKGAKAKKSTSTKSKQKKPAANKSSQGELRSGAQTWTG